MSCPDTTVNIKRSCVCFAFSSESMPRYVYSYEDGNNAKFPVLAFAHGFWRIAWLVFCVTVACLALLDMLAAAAGDAVLAAKTPGPCSLLGHTSRRMPCRAGSPSIVWPRSLPPKESKNHKSRWRGVADKRTCPRRPNCAEVRGAPETSGKRKSYENRNVFASSEASGRRNAQKTMVFAAPETSKSRQTCEHNGFLLLRREAQHVGNE